jgi:hypothetical protein
MEEKNKNCDKEKIKNLKNLTNSESNHQKSETKKKIILIWTIK